VGAVRQAGDLVAVDCGLGGDRGLIGFDIGLLFAIRDLGVTQQLSLTLVQRVDGVNTAGIGIARVGSAGSGAAGLARKRSICPARLPSALPFAVAGRVPAVGRCASCA
jgi:hypothetical protein